MARREPGAEWVVPSIVHLKAGHFSALVREEGGRYLLADPLLGGEFWISRAALEEEASGYSLLPDASLPARWKGVAARDVDRVRGKCVAASQEGGATGKCNAQSGGGGCGGNAMAVYSFNSFLASLHITDTPVRHAPPRGPAVAFRVDYNQREAFQPQTFTFSNLGRRWNFDWLSYVEDDLANPSAQAHVYLRGGGRETVSGFNGSSYAPHRDSRAVLVRVSSSPIRYQRQLPDGSVEVFGQWDGAVSPRRVLMTEFRDHGGQAVTLSHDLYLRVAAVTDALGQVTTLSYDHADDPLKITKVTDPFGRTAQFDYDLAGSLVKITDLIGITSEFEYGQEDFIRALTTPYGTSTFAYGTFGPRYYPTWWLEATDPLGAKERIEYSWAVTDVPASEPALLVPTGFVNNQNLETRSSFYWDKRAMALHPGDHSKAHHMRWLWAGNLKLSSVLHSEKRPLENRVWYAQVGETMADAAGPGGRPAKIGRVLDDGTSQIYRFEWNDRGYPTKVTDPRGRQVTLDFAANGIDLVRVRQTTGQSNERLLFVENYNAQHLPERVTDASGQATTFTYTPQGQLQTITNPRNETVTFAYDAAGNYLTRITAPDPAATVDVTWDGYGRPRTMTYDSTTVTVDYDLMDRPTRITYPDATYEETVYRRLEAEQMRDRAGRWSRLVYDALHRLSSATDALGRTVTVEWCGCGSPDRLRDANGNVTTWERDLQGRVTRELRANASRTLYAYESTTSRVKTVRDAKDQETRFAYFIDDSLREITFTNTPVPTPGITLTYDPRYLRPLTRTDGTGLTEYAYHPVSSTPAPGAGQLASVDGPLANDTITYAYDELGRMVSRSINGIAESVTFDNLGRLRAVTNPLGGFTYAHFGATERLQSVAYPNGQTTTVDYFGVTGGRRLKEIVHRKPGGALLSRHDYTYEPSGNIQTWRQETDTDGAKEYEFGYDRADQLVGAVLRTTGTNPTVLKRYGYAYDRAGNRTSEQIDNGVIQAAHNNMNQATSLHPGGALEFAGTTSEPAVVTVQGLSTTSTAGNGFAGQAVVGSGPTIVEVAATDGSGNTATRRYQVTQAGATRTLTYDPNGNLLADGVRTYEWDALDQLVAVNQGTHRSEFTYDGEGRRVRLVEKENAAVTEDRRFLWEGTEIAEERTTAGGTLKRHFAEGVQQGGVAYLNTTDHLGSVREVSDGTGAVRARYDFDPYGRRTKASGDADSDLGFAGTSAHDATGLALAVYRAYDPAQSR